MQRPVYNSLLLLLSFWLVGGIRAAEERTASADAPRPGVTSPRDRETAPASYQRVYVLPEGDDLALPPRVYVDLDDYYGRSSPSAAIPYASSGDSWTWQFLPQGLIYRSYLAGPKEPRFGAQVVNIDDENWGWVFDNTMGARVGLLRFGTRDPIWPDGFQIDAEGASLLRLDIPNNVDMGSVDFRAGVPITLGVGRRRTKFGYYHLSSHLGDEFLLRVPNYDRQNYSRDVLILGHSIFLTPWLRLYGEAGWAFQSDICGLWEFQAGVDYAPPAPTSVHGAPFFALNGNFREEVDFNGGLTVQAGWAWRSIGGQLLRTGLQFYNGPTPQFSFFEQSERQLGFGLWYDF